MSQNVPLFRLSARRVKAAQLVAEDRLSDEQIGTKVGITRRQLTRWKRQTAFTDLVTEIAESLAAEIRGKGLVELSNRIDALNSRWVACRRLSRKEPPTRLCRHRGLLRGS
jgi:Helix-turn-helix of insertion element transposase